MFTTPEKVFGKRPYRENVLKYVNLFVFIANLVCFLVMAQDVDQKAKKSMGDFWTHGTFSLDSTLADSLLENCTRFSSLKTSDWDVYYTITKTNAPALMAHTAGLIRRAVWVTGTAVILGGVNKLLFERNVHDVGYYNIPIRKGYLFLLEIAAIVWSICAMEQPQEPSSFIKDYISQCSTGSISHVWRAPPFMIMYISHAVTLLLHGVTFFILISYSQPEHKTNRPLIRARYRELLSIVMLRKRGLDRSSGEDPLVEMTSVQLLKMIKERLLGEVNLQDADDMGVDIRSYQGQHPQPPPSQSYIAGPSQAPSQYDAAQAYGKSVDNGGGGGFDGSQYGGGGSQFGVQTQPSLRGNSQSPGTHYSYSNRHTYSPQAPSQKVCYGEIKSIFSSFT